MLEAPDLGNEDAGMPKEQTPGKPTTRRYSPEEKAAAVRMVRTLRAELGTEQGTVQRVAEQLGTAPSRCGCGCARPTSTRETRQVSRPRSRRGSRRSSRRSVSCGGRTRS